MGRYMLNVTLSLCNSEEPLLQDFKIVSQNPDVPCPYIAIIYQVNYEVNYSGDLYWMFYK